jgi:tetratricopeptide (TPR) repeat protein
MNYDRAVATLQSGKDWAVRGMWRNALICFEYALTQLLREDAQLLEILNAEVLLARSHYELKNYQKAEHHIKYAIQFESELSGPYTRDGNEFRLFLVLTLLGQQQHYEAERMAKQAHRVAMRMRPLCREHVLRCFATLQLARSALRGQITF